MLQMDRRLNSNDKDKEKASQRNETKRNETDKRNAITLLFGECWKVEWIWLIVLFLAWLACDKTVACFPYWHIHAYMLCEYMYVCMYVYVYVCMHVYMYVYVFVYVYMYVYMYVYVYVYMYVYMYVHMYVRWKRSLFFTYYLGWQHILKLHSHSCDRRIFWWISYIEKSIRPIVSLYLIERFGLSLCVNVLNIRIQLQWMTLPGKSFWKSKVSNLFLVFLALATNHSNALPSTSSLTLVVSVFLRYLLLSTQYRPCRNRKTISDNNLLENTLTLPFLTIFWIWFSEVFVAKSLSKKTKSFTSIHFNSLHFTSLHFTSLQIVQQSNKTKQSEFREIIQGGRWKDSQCIRKKALCWNWSIYPISKEDTLILYQRSVLVFFVWLPCLLPLSHWNVLNW